jgi:hypothetical protein
LLLLSGGEYGSVNFEDLHRRLCNALSGGRPRLLAESWDSAGRGRLLFEDGSSRDIARGKA